MSYGVVIWVTTTGMAGYVFGALGAIPSRKARWNFFGLKLPKPYSLSGELLVKCKVQKGVLIASPLLPVALKPQSDSPCNPPLRPVHGPFWPILSSRQRIRVLWPAVQHCWYGTPQTTRRYTAR